MAQRDESPIEAHTTAWNIQVWVSWAMAFSMLLGGILFLPIDWWARGYLVMGTMFTVGSTFTLAKTTRDNHEARKIRNRISSAKADKLLREFELSDAA